MIDRTQSLGEEIANSVIHGTALIGSLAALPVLVVGAARRGDPWQLVSGAIFGGALILLYSASTLYHAWRPGALKGMLQVLDHSAIYVLIAGTYTPFMLGPLRGSWGWTLLAIVWGLALFGIAAKCTVGMRFGHLSTVLYLAMGWLIVTALRPLIAHVSPIGVAWLVAGGLCYSLGVAFYVTDARVRYGHALWHLFVTAGSTCHFIAVLRYAGAGAT